MKVFLRKVGEHTVLTIISGLLLMLFAFLGTSLWQWSQEGHFSYPSLVETQMLVSPELFGNDIEISNVERVENVPNLTIKGTIKNVSEIKYLNIRLLLKYYVEGIELGECYESPSVNNLLPKELQFFIIECRKFISQTLPSNFSYKVYPNSGTRVYQPDKK